MRRAGAVGLFVLFGLLSCFTIEAISLSAFAEEEKESVQPEKKKRRRRYRERKIEGTKARNRIEAEQVIKSQYTYKGQSLDVDPD